MAKISLGIRDWGDEVGHVSLPVEEPTEIAGEGSIANYYSTLETAILGVILGTIGRRSFVIGEVVDYLLPTSQFAQREFGLRLFMQGVDSASWHTLTFPTVNADALELVPGTDQVVLADGGAMAALVTALEARLAYPYGDDVEQVVVREARIVGRNS